jgi:pSer/pThr/pTyr-binding forkhead associated (FHA) protein
MRIHARLIPQNGGAPLDVSEGIVVVGRDRDCDVRLNEQTVSRMHCVIVKNGDALAVRDLDSTNGTHVNGARVRRSMLAANDRLRIGFVDFLVCISAPALPFEEHTILSLAEGVPASPAGS